MAPLPPPSGASLARPFQVRGNTQQTTASPMMAPMTALTNNMTSNTAVLGHYPVMPASAQTSLPPAVPYANNAASTLLTNLFINPTIQGDHDQASLHSGVIGHILEFSNANNQKGQSDRSCDSDLNTIEMYLAPDATPKETIAPPTMSNHTSKIRSPRGRKLSTHCTKPRAGWPTINAKGVIPQKLANRLKDRFRAEIVADCRSKHFEECQRNTKAEIDKDFERITKEHAEELASLRAKAEKAIREARGERVHELKKIRKLEQAKEAIELKGEIKDQRICDLEADLRKSLATEGVLKKLNATAKIASRKAHAKSKQKVRQVQILRLAKEAALKDAAKEVTGLQAENTALKAQMNDVKEDLRTSTNKVENLKTLIAEKPSPTEADQLDRSILNLTSSVEQLMSVVAKQAESLANINSTMIDFKNVNETLAKELAIQKSGRAAADDKATGLLEMLNAERQKRKDLEKRIEIPAADIHKLTAAAAAAEALPTTKPSTAITIQDDTPLPKSSSLVIPNVAPAPTTTSLRNIFASFILLVYYFLFGNLFLTFSLLSLVVLPGTQLFLSAFFPIFHTNISTERETTADRTDADKKMAKMPAVWGWFEED